MAHRSIQQWFDAYGESHTHPTNKAIHWICVPTIYWCVVALLWSIPSPFPGSWPPTGWLAMAAVLIVALFYVRLSVSIMLGMALFSCACLILCAWLDRTLNVPLWGVALVLFAAAWLGQFYGHKVEGRKPSFLDDLQFLMIGPAWLMGFIYRRLGIGY
jgi:uncharacterized membrane protein YGL010W